MNTIVAKYLQIDSRKAERLQQLAASRGTTENALIEAALDLLFREQEKEAALQEDWELLHQFDAETGVTQTSSHPRIPIDPDDIISVVGTPLRTRRKTYCDRSPRLRAECL